VPGEPGYRINLRRGETVKKALILSVIACIAAYGCATGGQQAASTEVEGGGTTQDSRGFEKNYGPAEIAYQSAQQFLAAGNYDEAISHLRTATNVKPDYLEAWSDLGKTLTKVKDYQGGITAFERALALAPENQPLIASIAYNYLFLDNLDKAEENYAKLLVADSLSYEAHVHLGFIYQKKNDADRAIYHYNQALITQPMDAQTIGSIASLYEKKGDEAKKIEYLKRAVEAAPDDNRYKTQLGSAYMKAKDYQNALPIFESLVQAYPNEAAYYQNLGLILSQIPARKAEAPAALEKTLELKGDDAFVCGILAMVYNDLAQYQKAIAAAKRGLDLKMGQEPILYYQYGAALSKLEDFGGAIAMFQKVVATNDPQWTDAARKQIDRQIALKKRAEAKQQQQQ